MRNQREQTILPIYHGIRKPHLSLAVISAKPGARSVSQFQSARAMQDGVRLALLHFLQQLTDFRCGRRNDLDTALFPLR